MSIIKCLNLPTKDAHNSSVDPYVKLQLLPDKQNKVKTRVMRKTRNPVYEEDFSFYGIQASQLQVRNITGAPPELIGLKFFSVLRNRTIFVNDHEE